MPNFSSRLSLATLATLPPALATFLFSFKPYGLYSFTSSLVAISPKSVRATSISDILSRKEIGDKIDIIGPLGYGTFKTDKYNNLAVIGGGIGIFPLHELSKEAKAQKKQVSCYLGFRNKDFVMLEKEFEEVTDNLVITTDDGSYKNEGFAIDYLEKDLMR